MDNALKQRILGVIVLFALIGICITVLLHNNKEAQRQATATETQPLTSNTTTPTTMHHHRNAPTTTTSSPVETVVAAVPAPPPTNSVFTAINTTSSTPAPLPHAKKQVLETVPSPVALEQTTPTTQPLTHHTTTKKVKSTTFTAKTYSVHVGTFSSRANATALVKALKERGFSATTQSVKTKQGKMIRVVIGEKGLTRQQAESTKLRLDKTLQLKGIISPVAVGSKTTAKKPTTHTKATTTTSSTTSASTHSTTDNSGAVVIP